MFKSVLAICFALILGVVEPRSPVTVNLAQNEGSYQGTVHFNGRSHSLNLAQAAGSSFSKNFKLQTIHQDSNGETFIRDVTPTSAELYHMERTLYEDPDSDAVFQIQELEGETILYGVINDTHIRHDGISHEAVRQENLKRDAPGAQDSIAIPRPPKTNGNARILTSATSPGNATAEMLYIMDYTNYKNVGFSSINATNYASIMCRIINNRYSQVKIKAVVVALVCIGDRSEQPFIENNKCKDGSETYDIYRVLNDLGLHLYANQNNYGNNYDLCMLFSGETFKSETPTGSGTYTPGIVGLAYVRAACVTSSSSNMTYKCSVCSDRGGMWSGGPTAVHEMSHNLGSYHDGDASSVNCSWEDGYIMSYKGWGTVNKFYFSNCSCAAMNDFLSSSDSYCLYTKDAALAWAEAPQDPGVTCSMDCQCQKYTSRSYSVAVKNATYPDAECLNLKCSYTEKCKPPNEAYNCIYTVTTNTYPYDSSSCGPANSGKKCSSGKCV